MLQQSHLMWHHYRHQSLTRNRSRMDGICSHTIVPSSGLFCSDVVYQQKHADSVLPSTVSLQQKEMDSPSKHLNYCDIMYKPMWELIESLHWALACRYFSSIRKVKQYFPQRYFTL